MRFGNIKICAVFFSILAAAGCNRQDSKLVGTWQNVKTPSSIQFDKENKGVIYQRTNPGLPPNIAFKWTMLKENGFIVEVPVEGSAGAPQAHGKIGDDDTIVIENDTFKKVQ